MAEIRSALQEHGYDTVSMTESSKPLAKVKIAPRLFSDISALEQCSSLSHLLTDWCALPKLQ
jgi:hypothetical protein